MKKIEYQHLNYFLTGFFALQALPLVLLFLLSQPLLALLSSLVVLPVSVAVLVVLLLKGDAMMRLAKYQATLLLYILSILWHGNIWRLGMTQGFLD